MVRSVPPPTISCVRVSSQLSGRSQGDGLGCTLESICARGLATKDQTDARILEPKAIGLRVTYAGLRSIGLVVSPDLEPDRPAGGALQSAREALLVQSDQFSIRRHSG
jgi:hypothetical protein